MKHKFNNESVTLQLEDPLIIAGVKLHSRLFLGTGRFANPMVQNEAIRASGTQVLTFAVRRVNLEDPEQDAVLQHLEGMDEREKLPYIFLPNTSGAQTAEEAVRIARLARAASLSDWIKVEISSNPHTLLPEPVETLKATEMLVKEGFIVLPYTSDDPMLCRLLQESGAAAVMPGGAPIGTGLGILNPYNIERIVEESQVPVIIDAGLRSAKDATEAMELGADGVLLNTSVARAKDPVGMASAMNLAVQAGRLSYRSGRILKRKYATASSGYEEHKLQ